MRKILFYSMVLVLSVGMTGCRSDDEEKEVNEVKANDISLSFMNATYGEVSQSDLPIWISTMIDQINRNYSENKDINKVIDYSTYLTTQPSIYQCKWNDKVYYFIYSMFKSCVYCDSVFYPDGNVVNWESTEQTIDFVDNSTDWRCIFNPR